MATIILRREDFRKYIGKEVEITTRPIARGGPDYLTKLYRIKGLLRDLNDSGLSFEGTVLLLGGGHEDGRRGLIHPLPYNSVSHIRLQSGDL